MGQEADEGDKSNSNYAAQTPPERTSSERNTDFGLKVAFANPKRKPSPV